MSAELLRRAAAKIRDTAQAAEPGPWRVANGNALPGPDGKIGEPEWFIDSVPTLIAYGPVMVANAEHIALWSPGVAELVARVLDESAGWCEMYDDPGEAERVLHAEFALARRILGEDA